MIDLLMPVMDGLETTREIRAAGLTTEVVILTFYDELLSGPAHEAGAFAYLVKGCSVTFMLDVIHQAWRRAEAEHVGVGKTADPSGWFVPSPDS